MARLIDQDYDGAGNIIAVTIEDDGYLREFEMVRHGTWEMCCKTLKTDFATLTGTYPTCSLCGHVEFGVDKSTPYCPGCGAKMDGGD